MRLKSNKQHRQGAHLVLYGPKGAATHARLVSRTDTYLVEPDTPEAFLDELASERRLGSMLPPGRRFRSY